MKKATNYDSEDGRETLFSSSDDDNVQTNRGNDALVRGSMKKVGKKRG